MEDFNMLNGASPNSYFCWCDSETDAVGWVVLDKIINNVSGGGIFMHSNASLKETCDIAKNMTKKFTVTSPQIGGAKAGIRFDHRDPRAKEVLRRFIIANALLLKNVWVTAGDLNTDDAFIESVITEELKLSCCQHHLAEEISLQLSIPNLAQSLSFLISHRANDYAPLIEATVGYGLFKSIDTISYLTDTSNLEERKVIIQGFGAVGSNLAFYLHKSQMFRVVGISDKDGFIFCYSGIDIIELLDARKAKVEELKANGLPFEEASKNLCMNLTPEILEKYNFSAKSQDETSEDFLIRLLSSVEANFFCPCATRYAITQRVAETLVNKTFAYNEYRYIVSGANNAFGIFQDGRIVEDTYDTCMKFLVNSRVYIVPDWVSNSGTAQLFHRGLSVQFVLSSEQLNLEVLEACADPIVNFIRDAFLNCCKNPFLLPYECLKQAQKYIRNPKTFLESSQDIFAKNPSKSKYCLPPIESDLSVQQRFDIVRSVGIECTKDEELYSLLADCINPVAYDGFEPSGRMHIAQGLLRAVNANKLTKAGFTMIIWIADWFALMNHKMDGDLEKIKEVGRYFIEVWKCCGMDMSRVRFLWTSDEINSRPDEYWSTVIDIASWATIGRIKKCMQIQGRGEDKFEGETSSHIFYSAMQCADIFFLGADVCQLGLDQRKVNMLARDYSSAKGIRPPVILSHGMLPGLKKGQEKMSKSDPGNAIFMEDSREEVEVKIRKAFCEDRNLEFNPCMDYLEQLVFPLSESVSCSFDGIEYMFSSIGSVRESFGSGQIDSRILKLLLSNGINNLLEPVRRHFENDPYARDLFERVKSYRVTK